MFSLPTYNHRSTKPSERGNRTRKASASRLLKQFGIIAILGVQAISNVGISYAKTGDFVVSNTASGATATSS